ncbi:hypothetical protein LINPERHAP1_LOCUS4844 [Linum perenne]
MDQLIGLLLIQTNQF